MFCFIKNRKVLVDWHGREHDDGVQLEYEKYMGVEEIPSLRTGGDRSRCRRYRC